MVQSTSPDFCLPKPFKGLSPGTLNVFADARFDLLQHCQSFFVDALLHSGALIGVDPGRRLVVRTIAHVLAVAGRSCPRSGDEGARAHLGGPGQNKPNGDQDGSQARAVLAINVAVTEAWVDGVDDWGHRDVLDQLANKQHVD